MTDDMQQPPSISRAMEQTVAFSAIIQACYLVNQLARTGSCAMDSFRPLIHSLFEFNPRDTLSIYGGVANLRLGLNVLGEILNRETREQHTEVIKYTISVLQLESHARSRTDMLAIIRSRLQHAELASSHFDDDYTTVCAGIASLYQDTLSQLRHRIHVTGSITQLQNQLVANRIRSLLMTAFRAAFLWRQLGGKRHHLIFRQNNYRSCVRQLQASMAG